jgi:hypothetical protein
MRVMSQILRLPGGHHDRPVTFKRWRSATLRGTIRANLSVFHWTGTYFDTLANSDAHELRKRRVSNETYRLLTSLSGATVSAAVLGG